MGRGPKPISKSSGGAPGIRSSSLHADASAKEADDLAQEYEKKSWSVSLPGGYKINMDLRKYPRGPLDSGHVLVTPADTAEIEDFLSSLVHESLQAKADYNDPDSGSYNYEGAKNQTEALAPLLAHCFGCSVEEAQAEIDRVENLYFKQGDPEEARERRERCTNDFSSYSEAIDRYDEEFIDGIVSEHADTSDTAFAKHVLENSFSGDHIFVEIARYRSGEYGDYEGVSDEDIALEIIQNDEDIFEEIKKDWKEEIADEALEGLVARDDFLEVLQKHGVDDAYPDSDTAHSLAYHEIDFADFFSENSKFSPENIRYGPRELARDMGVSIDAIEEGTEESTDFLVEDGKMVALPELED